MAQMQSWGDFPPYRKAFLLLSAVIGFVGTGLFSMALVFLNLIVLLRHLLDEAKPGRLSLSSFSLAWPTVPWPSPNFRQETDKSEKG